MRLPQRRAQKLKIADAESRSFEVTPEALARMKRTLERLEKVERPKIVEDLSFAISLGDLRENAEYQDAKARLSRIDGRIFSLKDRIKNAEVIEEGSFHERIRIGSVVVIRRNGQKRTFHIVGSQETDPARGKISHLSPLGAALLGRKAGEEVAVRKADGSTEAYSIIAVG